MTKICFIGDIHGKNSTPLGRLTDYNEDQFAKLAWIRQYCEENDITHIVHLGDIYDKPEATDAWKNKFIQTWFGFKGKFYSIIGMAHDLFYNNEKSFDKTCLANLELSGVLKVLREKVVIDDVELIPLDMRIRDAKESLTDIEKDLRISYHHILVGHHFYEWQLDKSAGFTEEELSEFLTNCDLVLGHDHRQHETVQAGCVTVHRPGSLMRTELSEEMIKHRPRILIYEDHIWRYVEIPHKDINEIYNVQEYRSHKADAKAFRQIHNNLENVGQYLHKTDDIIPCSKALADLGCPKEEFEYLRAVYQSCGQAF